MNLILCATPLQAFLAIKIIDEQSDKFDCIMFCAYDSEKYRFYYEMLAKKCVNAEFVLYSRDEKWQYLKMLWQIRQRKIKAYDAIYLSNTNAIWIHAVLSATVFNEIYTFDDGMANIVKSSRLYDSKKGLVESLLYVVLNIKYNQEFIKKNTTAHYTIYPDFANIHKNLIAIQFFDKNIDFKKNKHTKKIMLGQPIFESDGKKSKEISQRVIKAFTIDHYFPHPREHYVLEEVEYIDTPMIFEQYLVSEIEKSPDCLFKIYTFYSSAALNVYYLPNVQVIAVKSEDKVFEDSVVVEAYQVFDNMGIKIECIY